MGKNDIEYFSRRMREELDAAAQAAPGASEVHRELAEKYEGVIQAYERQGEEPQA